MRFSNLRGDRIVLPTGMSYRGFCVPKEFFLIYAVLVAPTNREAAKKNVDGLRPQSGENAALEQLIEESFGEPTRTGAYTVKRDSFIGMLRESLRLEATDASDVAARRRPTSSRGAITASSPP